MSSSRSRSLEELEPLAGHVGAERARDYQTDQHHDLLPPRLGLVLQGLLGVVGSPGGVLTNQMRVYNALTNQRSVLPGGVLHRTLHMGVNPENIFYILVQ